MSTSRYEILHSLGKGGMAEVFLAQDQLFETKVALKILLPEFRLNASVKQRFLAEAKMLFKMSHPNIIKATDLIDGDEMVAYAMDFIEGKNLRILLDEGKLNLGELHQINAFFAPALNAVDYAHRNGILHRDLKPSNFMVSSSGEMKLMDFGIAKQSDSEQDYSLTITGQMIGTPKYMSPEQVRSTKHVTVHSDIYSLGVILWELASNKGVYSEEGLSAFDIQVKIVNEPLPMLDNPLDDIIQKATAKKPEERFDSVGEFKAALSALQQPSQNRAVDPEETILVSSPPSSMEAGMDRTVVDDTPLDIPPPPSLQSEPSDGSVYDEVVCPRCSGKGAVDTSDIAKWRRGEDWLPGPCAYCEASGKVQSYFADTYDPGDRRIVDGWRERTITDIDSWVLEAKSILMVYSMGTNERKSDDGIWSEADSEQLSFIDSFEMPVGWSDDWNEGVVHFTDIVENNQGIGLIGMTFPEFTPEAQYFFLLRSGAEKKPAVISWNRFDLLKDPLANGFGSLETELFWTSGECLLGHSMNKVWQEKSSLYFEYYDRQGDIHSYKFHLDSEKAARAAVIFWSRFIDSPLGFTSDPEEYDTLGALDEREPSNSLTIDGDYIKDRVSSFITKGLTNIISCFNEEWAGSKYSRHHSFLGRFKMPSPNFAQFSEGIYQDETLFGGGKSGIACVGIQFDLVEEPYYVLLVRSPMTEHHIIPLFKPLPEHVRHPAYRGLVAFSVAQNETKLVVISFDSGGDPSPVELEIGSSSQAELSVEFWRGILLDENEKPALEKLNFLSY